MAPAAAVQNIDHLLITTSEHGTSEHGTSDTDTSMAACNEFDKYLTEHDIERPIVLMSDGHSSRYDFDTLQFLLPETFGCSYRLQT